MLALLPELNDANPRQALGQIQGPRLAACEATPEVAQTIRDVELGKVEPPTLYVEASTGRLVLLNRPTAVLDWLVYKLGSFSTCNVKFVTLTSAERVENNRMFNTAQMLSTDKLLALIGATPEDPPMTEDDLPLEDDDIFPHEDEGAEEDR